MAWNSLFKLFIQCLSKLPKFQDLDIYEPDIIIANKVSLEGDSTEILYELDFMPNFYRAAFPSIHLILTMKLVIVRLHI